MRTSREIQAEMQAIATDLLTCPFGVSYLDDALLGMRPGGVTLVGARTGGGKTEFATQVLLEQQRPDKNRARSVLYFALDHEQGEIEKRVLWRLLAEQIKAIDPYCGYLRYAEWAAGKYLGKYGELESDGQLYLDHLLALSETRFLYRKSFSIEEIVEQIKTGDQYNLFIIDHFHAIKFQGNQFDAQVKGITEICEAAELVNRPVMLLGQFRKRNPTNKSPLPEMEEFSGHSNLIYLPQNIIVLAPRYTEGQQQSETYFNIEKARFAADTKGFVGVHSFDIEKKTYSQKYQIMRKVPFSEPLPIEGGKIPKWAIHAAHTTNPPQPKGLFSRDRAAGQ